MNPNTEKDTKQVRGLARFFHLLDEQEDYQQITETITKGVVFSGTNLWVLVFAIFVASVGLNVNSTAVIIGAMLISPLMTPIMGIGLGLGTYDLDLIKRSIQNLSFAVGVSLFASTLYFLISPLNQAHSELFARTSPNIYDVLIAFFGGLAGIIAITSKQKGNALQGAAIATALMPPLCTAGFGIATLQWDFFFGAFYLFIINSVFISLATYITVRLLKFPPANNSNPQSQLFLKRIVIAVVSLTLIPSIYLGYQLTQAERFNFKVNQFIENEAVFEDSYLLNKNINFAENSIFLTIGGSEIDSITQKELQEKLKFYELKNTQLVIKNTLSFKNQYQELNRERNNRVSYLNNEILLKQKELQFYKQKLDSITDSEEFNSLIIKEINALYPSIKTIYLSKSLQADSLNYQVFISSTKPINPKEIDNLKKWLEIRLNTSLIDIYVIKEEY
jgi:uncharacterized hydrophobic protein (TIGR00271 family)